MTLDPGHRNLDALDGIRAIAVLLVLASHFERFLPTAAVLTSIKALLVYGWSGVDLFFVLSGFLITGILLKTKASPNYFRSFYVRRVLRIFPLYYAVLLLVFGLAAYLPAAAQAAIPLPSDRWLYFTYLTNWLGLWHGTWGPNVIGHFWSLAVEEQFYLVWPMIVLSLSERRIAIVSIGLTAIALVVRLIWVGHDGPSQAVFMATITRMDALAVGALGAIILRHTLTARRLRLLRWIGAGALVLYVMGAALFDAGTDAFSQRFGFTLLALGFGSFVVTAAATDGRHSFFQRVLVNHNLRTIGRYSYGMYVYHVPILGACEIVILHRLPASLATNPFFAIGYVVFLTAATYVVAALSYELFERRFLTLKRFFEPTTRAAESKKVLTVAADPILPN